MSSRAKPYIGVIVTGCVACGRGFHRECGKCRGGAKQCHANTTQEKSTLHEEINESTSESPGPRKRKSARENLKDPKSTGRKRAAELYPIEVNSPCEWRGLRNCGGGRRPIVGCFDGIQQHRHHGPVKETTRNEEGNVHRICTACHVHWHELNDLVYDEREYNLLPHAPTPATDMEIIQNTLDWKTGEIGKRFELASTKNREKNMAKKLAEEEEGVH